MSEIPRGAIRFNTDSNKPELWDGSQWAEFQLSTPNLGRTVIGAGVDYSPGWSPSGINNPEGAFDGDLSTLSGSNGGSFGPFTYTFSPAITDVTSARMYVNLGATSSQVASTVNVIKADGTDVTAKAKTANAFSNTGSRWIDVTSEVGDTWNTFQITGTSGSTNPFVAAIEVNGQFIISNYPNERGPGPRGLFNGGQESPTTTVNKIEYINIASTGNSVDFGDLTRNAKNAAACASSVTGVVAGGESFNDIIEKYTIASTGSCVDSGGNLSSATQYSSGLSNSTRGIFALGYIPGPGNVDTLEYITISSIGNSVDFGNLQLARRASGTCASPTRGLFGGGIGPSGVNIIDFVTIATLGNGQDFGDLLNTQWDGAGVSNPIRGLWGGGATPTNLNTIQYVNISSTGNSIKFGDLSVTRRQTAGCSSSTRGVWGGGETYTDTIDYVNITTEGDAVDFGNLSSNRTWMVGCSNAHGGL